MIDAQSVIIRLNAEVARLTAELAAAKQERDEFAVAYVKALALCPDCNGEGYIPSRGSDGEPDGECCGRVALRYGDDPRSSRPSSPPCGPRRGRRSSG